MYEADIRQWLEKLAFIDDVSYYHCLHVGYYLSEFVKTEVGKKFLKQAWVTQNEFITAGMLHEIGKLNWPREVLLSTETLRNMKYDDMTSLWLYKIQHPLMAEKIIMEVYKKTGNRFWERIAGGIAAHHENFDGSGYPYGLKNTEIPLLARGLRLFDSYAAMQEFRRYRGKKNHDETLKKMKKFLGCRYDPYWGEQILDFLTGVKPCKENLDDWFEKQMIKLG